MGQHSHELRFRMCAGCATPLAAAFGCADGALDGALDGAVGGAVARDGAAAVVDVAVSPRAAT